MQGLRVNKSLMADKKKGLLASRSSALALSKAVEDYTPPGKKKLQNKQIKQKKTKKIRDKFTIWNSPCTVQSCWRLHPCR